MRLAQRIWWLAFGCLPACAKPAALLPSPAAPGSGPARAATPAQVAAPLPTERAGAAKPSALVGEALALPGATGPVSLDFLFYERKQSRVWVPAGGTGSVDVFDINSRQFARVAGFKTAERETHGKKRALGPSSGAVGDGFAYVGNRASDEVCAIELRTLSLGKCLKLPAPVDGIEFVPSTRQVWVTMPSAHAIAVLDVAPQGTLALAGKIELDGEPEGYALDEPHGLFLTNLEDKGSTLRLDLKTHEIRDTWPTGCAADGPRGVAADSKRQLIFVACTDHVQALDAAHDGARLGTLDTGAGLDIIDYAPSTGLLYAAAGKASRLTVAHVGDRGLFDVVAVGDTAVGARNAVADERGNIFVADPQGAHLLVFRAPEPPPGQSVTQGDRAR